MGTRRRFGAAVVAATMVFGLGACSASSLPTFSQITTAVSGTSTSEALATLAQRGQATVSNEALVEDGTLTVGIRTDRVSAPLCFEQNGSYAGLDVDLAAAMADSMGLKLKVVSVGKPADSLGKTCDVVMDLSSQDASDAGGIQVVGSYEESAAAFWHKGATGTALVSDLSSKTVGVQGGSVSAQALANTGLVMQTQSYDNLNDAFAALEKGDVDYVLCDAYSGAYLSRSYSDLAFCGTLNAPVARGIGVLTTNTALQQAVANALTTVQSNGQGDLIRSLWLGGMASIQSTDQVKDIPAAEQSSDESTASMTVDVGAGDGSSAGSNAVSL